MVNEEKETNYYFITFKPPTAKHMTFNAIIEGSPMKFAKEYEYVILFAMEIDKEQYEKYKDEFS